MIIIKYNLFHTHFHLSPIPSPFAWGKFISDKVHSISFVEETFEKKKNEIVVCFLLKISYPSASFRINST